MVIFIAFTAVNVTSCVINNVSASVQIYIGVIVYTILMMIEVSIHTKRFAEFLTAFIWVLQWVIVAQAVSRFIYPDGLYIESHTIWFFVSNDNSFMPFIYLHMILVYLRSSIMHGKITFMHFVLIVLDVMYTVYTWSGTGVIAVMVLTLAMIYSMAKKVKKLKLITVILSYFAFSVMLIWFQEFVSSQFAEIFQYMNKTGDFSGRTYLWKEAMRLIQLNPIIGYGYLLFPHPVEGYIAGAHNQILQIVVNGGLLALLFFAVYFAICAKRITRNSTDISNFMMISIGAFLIGMSFEIYDGGMLFFIMLALFKRYTDYCKNDAGS